MAHSIPIPFFGRCEELAGLEARCASPGLTIVKGPPRIGKTRLLTHFVERSRAAGSCRIGMAEAGEAAGDVLLRAIKDAYDHWLTGAGMAGEARSVLQQMEGKWITKAGVGLGKALAKVAGVGEDLVKAGFTGLAEAQRMIESGGVQLDRLSSEEARNLLAILAKGQTGPVVIVLNQWESGQDIGKDIETLHTFLSHTGEWPDLHVILHLRDPRYPYDRNQEAGPMVKQLHQYATVETREIGHIDFGTDEAAYEALLGWLQANFPAFADIVVIDQLSGLALEEIGGNPAVLEEWAGPRAGDRDSLDLLGRIAADARAMRYPELRVRYRALLDEARADEGRRPVLEVALLAAVLPLPTDAAEMERVLPAVLGDATEDDLDRLESIGLLLPERGLRLSLGHPSRREAADGCVLGHLVRQEEIDGGLATGLRPYLRRAVDRVIPALVELHTPEAWSGLGDRTFIVAAMLAASSGLVEAADAGPAARVLCAAAGCLFPGRAVGAALEGAAVAAGPRGAAARTLVAEAMTNAIAESGANTALADRLLAELRSLAEDHPGEPALREQLARGLFNTAVDSQATPLRADELLKELRSLAEAHPGEAALHEVLAHGLFNALIDSEANSPRADGLLAEMRSLSERRPGDAVLREQIAKGLNNRIANRGGEPARVDESLRELRSLAGDHPGEAAVRNRLASGLSNAIAHSGGDAARADGLLRELRSLAEVHPGEAAVRGILATGLFNAFNDSESNSARAGELLRELRSLAEAHPGEAALREELAAGLFNAFSRSGANSTRAGELLRELRSLAGAHPDEAALREPLAKGLTNAIVHSGADGARADGLLGELRSLAGAHHGEAALREQLARGLNNAIIHSGADGTRADGLFAELRSLAGAHPGEAALREQLARGLGAAMRSAVLAGDLDRAAGLAEALFPIKDAVDAQPGIAGLIRRDIGEALDLAVKQDARDAGVQLLAASKALFGG